jgi:hypothetical protein
VVVASIAIALIWFSKHLLFIGSSNKKIMIPEKLDP